MRPTPRRRCWPRSPKSASCSRTARRHARLPARFAASLRARLPVAAFLRFPAGPPLDSWGDYRQKAKVDRCGGGIRIRFFRAARLGIRHE